MGGLRHSHRCARGSGDGGRTNAKVTKTAKQMSRILDQERIHRLVQIPQCTTMIGFPLLEDLIYSNNVQLCFKPRVRFTIGSYCERYCYVYFHMLVYRK